MRSFKGVGAIAAAALLTSCGGSDAPTAATTRGIRFVSGADVADTVLSTLTQALVVEVHGSDGTLASTGTTVTFSRVSAGNPLRIESLVSPTPVGTFSAVASGTTDANGRASIFVKLGTIAGAVRIAVSVPTLGLSDTARYTIRPGAAGTVTIQPADTTVYAPATVAFRGGVTDRFGNARSDQIVWTVSDPSATISTDGTLRSTATGRFTVTGTVGSATGFGAVSSIPHGRMVASLGLPSAGLELVDLDGTNVKALVALSDGGPGFHPAWMPDGTIVFTSLVGNLQTIQVTDTNGVSHPFFRSGIPNVTHAADPSPTGDGRWLYFSAVDSRCNSGAQYCLYRSRIDGSAPELIGTAATSGRDLHPSPSPDGSRVAFETGEFGSGAIKVLDVATGVVADLSSNGAFPSWSPDGKQIAFVGNFGGPIFVINPDASSLRLLAGQSVGLAYGQITWSKDGKFLLARSSIGLALIDVSTGSFMPLGSKLSLVAGSLR